MPHKDKEKHRECVTRYNNRPEVKARRKEYYASQEVKDRIKERLSTPEEKAKKRERDRDYRIKPENRKRKSEQSKEYHKRLEVKEARKIREQSGRHKAMKKKSSWASVLRNKYGLTVDEYDQMLISQDGKCALCGKESKQRRLCVDHDHSNDKVRKLLCTICNAVLGLVNEDKLLLEAMIQYLEDHSDG